MQNFNGKRNNYFCKRDTTETEIYWDVSPIVDNGPKRKVEQLVHMTHTESYKTILTVDIHNFIGYVCMM